MGLRIVDDSQSFSIAQRRATPLLTKASAATYRFDRRQEHRAATTGWAQVLVLDSLKTLLGGSMQLLDVSPHGIGLVSHHPIEPGEALEVRLAPFRVRGRLGVVAHCEEVKVESLTAAGADGAEHSKRYRLGVRFPRRSVA